MEYNKSLSAVDTGILGLTIVDLSVYGDTRGWFKENWQRAKMCELGIPDHRWVQNNISFNASRGVTRGIHAEPWDKWISVATGSVFGAWVDLRAGSLTYGKVFTAALDPSKAIYVPRGVGNSFQALEDGTTYIYLVNEHWSADLKSTYTFVNLADPDLKIDWPIPLSECELSLADKQHPMLSNVNPMKPKRTLVTGCRGQLGRAVKKAAEDRGLMCFDYTDIEEFDFADELAYDDIDWGLYGTVINCGAFTAVDASETSEGRAACWRANASGPSMLARMCNKHDITLVHVSSDYVFDGTLETHDENEGFSPLGVYGQSKAAGDLAVAGCQRYFIIRSSWVIGSGYNFVRTMMSLSDRCANQKDSLSRVTVVDDQIGRLTFTDQMADGILWLLGYRNGSVLPSNPAPYGVYNLTGEGSSASWYDIAKKTFDLRNQNGNCVSPVKTDEYYKNAAGPIAPRPSNSTLNLSKIEGIGFRPREWVDELSDYIDKSNSEEA